MHRRMSRAWPSSNDTTVSCNSYATVFRCYPTPNVLFDSLGTQPSPSLDRRCIDWSFVFFREDAFQKEDNSFNDIRFEEASVLYNIAAMYSRMGANENRKTHDVCSSSSITTVSLTRPVYRRVSKMLAPGFEVQQHVMRKCAINTPPTQLISLQIFWHVNCMSFSWAERTLIHSLTLSSNSRLGASPRNCPGEITGRSTTCLGQCSCGHADLRILSDGTSQSHQIGHQLHRFQTLSGRSRRRTDLHRDQRGLRSRTFQSSNNTVVRMREEWKIESHRFPFSHLRSNFDRWGLTVTKATTSTGLHCLHSTMPINSRRNRTCLHTAH